MDLKEEIKLLEPEVIRLRRDIHMHPELGTKEYRTSQLVEDYLHDLGIETQKMFGTGVVGLIRGENPGKTILLRADMDALPVNELNDVPYKSQNEGIMHACGHDAHTAMLLVAAKVLSNHKKDLHGNVKLVFEPNEEDCGAHFMVEEGVLENPKVDASFAMHVNNGVEKGKIGLQAGPMFAETDNFYITLTGTGGHTSEPQKCRDPIICAAAIIQQAQILQTREINPTDTTVLMFGSIHSGTINNVVPDTAELSGTIRYLYDGSQLHPQEKFERIVKSIAETYRIEADVRFEVSAYALVNDAGFVDFMNENVVPQAIGSGNTVSLTTMAGEDFCEFINRNNIPGAMAFLGTGNAQIDAVQPLHHPEFKIDEESLIIGVELHVRTAMEFLAGGFDSNLINIEKEES